MFMYELVVKFKSCYYVAISIQINFSEFCKAFGLYLNLSEQTTIHLRSGGPISLIIHLNSVLV